MLIADRKKTAHEIMTRIAMTSSEVSDEPARKRSLARAFFARMHEVQTLMNAHPNI